MQNATGLRTYIFCSIWQVNFFPPTSINFYLIFNIASNNLPTSPVEQKIKLGRKRFVTTKKKFLEFTTTKHGICVLFVHSNSSHT